MEHLFCTNFPLPFCLPSFLLLLLMQYYLTQDWSYNAYKIFDPAHKNGTIDIPPEFRPSTSCYSASLAHKTNHSFLPNAEFVAYDHPRFGLVPCLMCTHDVEPGEEIFVHYGYELDGCPEWYEEAWLKGEWASFGGRIAFCIFLCCCVVAFIFRKIFFAKLLVAGEKCFFYPFLTHTID